MQRKAEKGEKAQFTQVNEHSESLPNAAMRPSARFAITC